MDISIHRVSEIGATAAEYVARTTHREFSCLKIAVRTDTGEWVEFKLFGSTAAPFAQIAAAINAAYAKEMAQKEDAA